MTAIFTRLLEVQVLTCTTVLFNIIDNLPEYANIPVLMEGFVYQRPSRSIHSKHIYDFASLIRTFIIIYKYDTNMVLDPGPTNYGPTNKNPPLPPDFRGRNGSRISESSFARPMHSVTLHVTV